MSVVYDPELFQPHRESFHGIRAGILEGIPVGLPQPREHFLYKGSANKQLVSRAVRIYADVQRVINEGTRVRSGIDLPVIQMVRVKQFPSHMQGEHEESLMLSGMYGFNLHQEKGEPPKFNVFLSPDGNRPRTMAPIGYFDLGRPTRSEFPFMNESGTLGYPVALDVARIAMATLERNATLDRWD